VSAVPQRPLPFVPPFEAGAGGVVGVA
jgi:hypothetical protein